MNYVWIAVGWLFLGLIAKGIIRGNNMDFYRRADLGRRKTAMSVYWSLRWERSSFLLGPIGLFKIVHYSLQRHSHWSLKRFSLKPHGLGVRLAFVPTYYNGRLVPETQKET